LEGSAEESDADRQALKEFWGQSDAKVQELRRRLERFRETVQYGDPLVIASRFGKGRVVAFFTTAGRGWNDWAGGGPASVTYPVVMLDLQKYLTGADNDDNRTVGTPLEIQADSSRFESRMHCYFQQGVREGDAGPAPPPGKAGFRDLGERLGSLSGNRLTFTFDAANDAGVYHFELLPRADAAVEPKPETRAYAFNVDTTAESDLHRAKSDDLEKLAKLSTPNSGSMADLVNRPSDLSESAWFYLLFLAVLIAEQALAVHLSFHLRANEAPAATRSQAPVQTSAA
jgi:hypothetical protein